MKLVCATTQRELEPLGEEKGEALFYCHDCESLFKRPIHPQVIVGTAQCPDLKKS